MMISVKFDFCPRAIRTYTALCHLLEGFSFQSRAPKEETFSSFFTVVFPADLVVVGGWVADEAGFEVWGCVSKFDTEKGRR